MPTRRELLRILGHGGVAAAAGGLAGSAAAPALAAGRDGEGGAPSVTVLTNATVIDGTGAGPQPDSILVLVDDRIAAVGSTSEVSVPYDATVIDLHGKYLLPGFWDMHTHGSWLLDTFVPMHLANGVTAVREMVGPPGMGEIRNLLNSGQVPGPWMVLASELVDGPHSSWGGGGTGSGVIEARTPDEGRAAVRAARESGADFVKVYSFLFPEVYRAIAAEADRVGIRFSGHVPAQVTVDEAVRRGQHTMEHLYGMFLSTSRDKPELYRRMRATFADPDRADEWGATMGALEREAAETHDPRRADRLFAHAVRNGTWVSPTLGVERTASAPGEEILGDQRLMDLLERYIRPTMRQQWRASARARLDRPPEENERRRRHIEARARLTGEMADAGVRLVGGTDCWIPFLFPGFSLHDELALLVDAGLSEMRALQAVTRDAAHCVGWHDRSGTVTPGKLADLVILDDDPLRDIRHTTGIHAVVSRGRYLSRRERERMLADAEEAARHDPEPANAAGNDSGHGRSPADSP